eukprot:CAMPEP_0197632476 /NCGR_PEP_ID=MMETSP1338-20131121/9210_1 /TAXON_ID=43686 ORGANISM="Pelagodinium beii, Strain RCC1491" /NCGR_SAMPLE_ID=MMETSP1338 /ASSEMBLY_ACC=CAM_ASM_000754 /LENGTH=73 /DNA_ID=CAMNT_0043204041 /DNA_START=694 /DNA_END=915 /DNA_ORIENTATION=-
MPPTTKSSACYSPDSAVDPASSAGSIAVESCCLKYPSQAYKAAAESDRDRQAAAAERVSCSPSSSEAQWHNSD